MSDYEEATTAAAAALHTRCIGRGGPVEKCDACPQVARVAVAAAAPLIEAAVRAKVAAEIRAKAAELDALTITHQDRTAITVLQIKRDGLVLAARIAEATP